MTQSASTAVELVSLVADPSVAVSAVHDRVFNAISVVHAEDTASLGELAQEFFAALVDEVGRVAANRVDCGSDNRIESTRVGNRKSHF